MTIGFDTWQQVEDARRIRERDDAARAAAVDTAALEAATAIMAIAHSLPEVQRKARIECIVAEALAAAVGGR